jgi:hypothetical protein
MQSKLILCLLEVHQEAFILMLRLKIKSIPGAQFDRDIIKDKTLEEESLISQLLLPFSPLLHRS